MVSSVDRSEAPGSPSSSRAREVAILLFALLGPPVAWSLHFGALYFLVAALCAAGVRSLVLPIGSVTIVAAAISLGAGLVARRQRQALETGGGTGSRPLFLYLGMVGAVFFTLVILLEALPPLFLPPCPPSGR